MPITYAVDPTGEVVVVSWRGVIDRAAVREHWLRVVKDPASLSISRWLSDLRDATIRVTVEELEALAEEILVPGLGNRSHVVALVVEDTDQLRLSRRYNAVVRHLAYAPSSATLLQALIGCSGKKSQPRAGVRTIRVTTWREPSSVYFLG